MPSSGRTRPTRFGSAGIRHGARDVGISRGLRLTGSPTDHRLLQLVKGGQLGKGVRKERSRVAELRARLVELAEKLGQSSRARTGPIA